MFKNQKILSVFVAFSLCSCVSIKQPIITGIKNIKLDDKSSGIRVKFDVLIQNPNNFSVVLQNMRLDTFMDDSVTSTIGIDNKQRILAGTLTSVPITVEPKVSMLPRLALSGIQSILKNDRSDVKVRGVLVVRKSLIRKKYRFSFPE